MINKGWIKKPLFGVIAMCLITVSMTACGQSDNNSWLEGELEHYVPKPDHRLEIISEREDGASFSIIVCEEDDYETFIEMCRESGFTANESAEDDHPYQHKYYAENAANGYYMTLLYDEDETRNIFVDVGKVE